MINYETEVEQRHSVGKSVATIADEINSVRRAFVSNYRPITYGMISDWLIEEGTLAEMQSWLNSNSSHLQYRTLQSALNVLVANSGNPESQVLVGPGQKHRVIFEIAVSVGALSQTRLKALIEAAYTEVDETAETVQAAIDDHNKSIVQSDFENELASAQLAAHASINGGGNLADAWVAFDASRGV